MRPPCLLPARPPEMALFFCDDCGLMFTRVMPSDSECASHLTPICRCHPFLPQLTPTNAAYICSIRNRGNCALLVLLFFFYHRAGNRDCFCNHLHHTAPHRHFTLNTSTEHYSASGTSLGSFPNMTDRAIRQLGSKGRSPSQAWPPGRGCKTVSATHEKTIWPIRRPRGTGKTTVVRKIYSETSGVVYVYVHDTGSKTVLKLKKGLGNALRWYPENILFLKRWPASGACSSVSGPHRCLVALC
jgi:hypothetical protein